MIKELIYLPIDIPNPPNVCKFFDKVTENEMIIDNYRTCLHIPLMSPKGELTSIGEKVPELIEWLYEYVIPWTAPTRVRVLVTEPRHSNAPHIDCSPKKFKSLQHKFRYVFQGKRDSLIFYNGNENVTIPDIDKPYMINGAWPHEMINDCDERKYTLVLGAPWEPKETDTNYVNMINKSFKSFKKDYIGSHEWSLPENYKSFFEEKYKDDLHLLEEN